MDSPRRERRTPARVLFAAESKASRAGRGAEKVNSWDQLEVVL